MSPAASNNLRRVKLMDAGLCCFDCPDAAASSAVARRGPQNPSISQPVPCSSTPPAAFSPENAARPVLDNPPRSERSSAACSTLRSDAVDYLAERMRKHGGKVAVATGVEADASGYVLAPGELVWDHSNLLHYQIITARVEQWGAGGGPNDGPLPANKAENEGGGPGNGPLPAVTARYAAVCREGSAAKPLLKWVAWLLFLGLLGGSIWWLRSGWCVAIGFALLLLTLWLVLRPSRKSVRRMLRLSEELRLER